MTKEETAHRKAKAQHRAAELRSRNEEQYRQAKRAREGKRAGRPNVESS